MKTAAANSNDEKFNLAQQKASDGDFEGALKLFLELVLFDPQSRVYQMMLAKTHQDMGNLKEAAISFKVSTVLMPEKEKISFCLFHCLWDQGRREEAIQEAKRFLAIRDSVDYRRILEEIEAKDRWKSEMEADKNLPLESRIAKFQEIIARGPVYAEFYQDLASLQIRIGNMEEAQQTFDRAIELSPTNAWNHVFFGNWFYHLKDYGAALVCFQKAGELMPDNSTPCWCSAEMLERLDRLEEADAQYREAIRLDPQDEAVREKFVSWLERYQRVIGEKSDPPPILG